MDNILNMQKDIANTCRATYMHIRKTISVRWYLNEQTTRTLVNATVLSRLDYCNGVNTVLLQKNLHKLQLALHAAARLITGTPIHDHTFPVLQQLKWLPISKRCQFKLLVLTFPKFP